MARELATCVAAFFLTCSLTVSAEELLCTFKWEHQEESRSFILEINGDEATIRHESTLKGLEVAVNTGGDLLIYQPIPRRLLEHPLGFLTIAIDKNSSDLVYSVITLKSEDIAHGHCKPVDR